MATETPGRLWWYVLFDCPESDKECLSRWNAIHITAIVAGSLSMFAVLLMIALAVKYRRFFSSLSFAAHIPIYIGICDLGYEIFHTGDHWHSLTKGYVMEGGLCQFFGSMKGFWINTQSAWALGCSLYLFRFLLSWEHQQPTFGKHNIYLHLCCWGLPIVAWILGWIFNTYGPEAEWCGLVDPVIDLIMVDLWMFLALSVLIVLYAIIVYKLTKIVKTTQQNNSENDPMRNRAADRLKKVIRLVGLYPLAYISQWLVTGLYKLHLIGRGDNHWGLIMYIVITTNAGGVFNCLLYGPLLWNQLKRAREKHLKMNSTEIHMASSGDLGIGDGTADTADTSTQLSSPTALSPQLSATPSV